MISSLGALVSPLAKDVFALNFAGGAPWASRFIAGPENALPLRAAVDFCAPRNCHYNPLTLYGPSGVGKTHLARGIARQLGELETELTVAYASGADFARAYAEAVESRSVPAWRGTCRSADLFLLDDLEQLADKPAAQIELLHTLDALRASGARILVTARELPASTQRILPALAGRLSAGLAVRIAAPGSAARLSLLKLLAAARSLPIDDSALDLLADEFLGSAPELSGALHDLEARRASNEPISTQMVLAYLRTPGGPRRPKLSDVAARTARYYALRVAELRGPSRRKNIAGARAVAMYVARKLTGKSYSAVGKYFGGRDHTTVLHGCRKTEALVASDLGLRRTVLDLESQLGSSSA